jgi:probable rRNA maturation factor
VRVLFAGDRLPRDADAAALRRGLREVLAEASSRLGVGAGDVVVRFVDEPEIRELNRAWRGKDHPTDVLSFPSGVVDPAGRRHVGDIALCLPVAARQAARRRHGAGREAMLLALHGLLHLLGYDHETDDGEMESLERRLRRECLPPRA